MVYQCCTGSLWVCVTCIQFVHCAACSSSWSTMAGVHRLCVPYNYHGHAKASQCLHLHVQQPDYLISTRHSMAHSELQLQVCDFSVNAHGKFRHRHAIVLSIHIISVHVYQNTAIVKRTYNTSWWLDTHLNHSKCYTCSCFIASSKWIWC